MTQDSESLGNKPPNIIGPVQFVQTIGPSGCSEQPPPAGDRRPPDGDSDRPTQILQFFAKGCPVGPPPGIFDLNQELSAQDYQRLAQQMNYQGLISFYESTSDVHLQRRMLYLLDKVCNAGVTSDSLDCMGKLLEIARISNDSEVTTTAQQILLTLLSAAPEPQKHDSVLLYFCDVVAHSASFTTVVNRASEVLARLAERPAVAAVLAEHDLDFSTPLLEGERSGEVNRQHRVMKTLLPLLPSHRMLEPLGHARNERSAQAHRVAAKVRPAIERVLVQRPLVPGLALLVFAATCISQAAVMSCSLVSALAAFCERPDCAPFALGILVLCCKSEPDVCGRLLKILQGVEVPERIQRWYHQGLMFLARELQQGGRNRDYSQFGMQDFVEEAKKGGPDWFDFLFLGGVERCVELITAGVKAEECRGVAEFASGLLNDCPLPPDSDRYDIDDFLELVQKHSMVELDTLDSSVIRVKSPLFAAVSMIEWLANSDSDPGLEAALRAKIQGDPELAALIQLEPSQQLPASHMSVLGRGILDEYPSFRLVGERQTYTVSESHLSIVSDSRESMQPVPKFRCEKVSPDADQAPAPKFRPYRCRPFELLFQFLDAVNRQLDSPILNEQFVRRIEDTFKTPFLSIGRLSPTFAIVFQYPYLFPLRLRELAFKLIALDPLSAIGRLIQEFPDDRTPDHVRIPPHQIPIKFTLTRETLEQSGRLILSRFAGHRIPFDIRFKDELGSGPGVAREFFSLLSQSFRSDRSLYRHDDALGLFPAPSADPQQFEQLGTLVAKALSLDCLVELPFNPAFFELVRGRQIGLEQVDPVLARSLEFDLTGLDFEYPGYPGLFGQKDELITSENSPRFVQLVREYTVARRPAECAQAFLRGFEKVISFDLLRVFSAPEIAQLIAGDTTSFTTEDFVENVEVTGYSRESKELQLLAETLAGFTGEQRKQFLQFVTGAPHLPLGGLPQLKPRLNVVKMETDNPTPELFLPSSSVCSNILRLPPYPSRSTLESKLLLAMSFGKDSFHLG